MKHVFKSAVTTFNLGLFCLVNLTSMVAASKLDTLFARGDSCINISWTPDDRNTATAWYVKNGSLCTGADSVYRHSDFKSGVTYKSIAYSYGGEDGYLKFRDKINNGLLAGSHMCHYNFFGDPSGVIAGTDCSGFVCYLWGVSRVSTRELHTQYKIITRDELDAGDILVKSGSHAVVVIEHDEDTRYLIWESTSTVNGCRERIIDLTDSYWDSYYPRRYEGLTAPVLQASVASVPNRFPVVKADPAGITLTSDVNWTGVVSAFSLDGRVLLDKPVVVDNVPRLLFKDNQKAGCIIIRLKKSDGATCAIPLYIHR